MNTVLRGAGAGAGEPDDEKTNLMIWHWKDARLQSQQQVQESARPRYSYLAAYWPRTNRWSRWPTTGCAR